MTDFARPAVRITDAAFMQMRRRVRRRQMAPEITIRWTLLASVAVAVFALGGPPAHSAGGNATGLPFSSGNDPTRWVPFTNITQPVTAAAKQKAQGAECTSAEYKDKSPDQGDRNADGHKCR
jgi:hypothetical protein